MNRPDYYCSGENDLLVPRGPDPEITAANILRVFLSTADPVLVPREVADELGVSVEGARHQMNNLVEQGLLAKKKPSQRVVLYWVTEKGKQRFAQNTGDF